MTTSVKGMALKERLPCYSAEVAGTVIPDPSSISTTAAL